LYVLPVSKELGGTCRLPSVVTTVKCRRLWYAGHVARLGDNGYGILELKPLGNSHLKNQEGDVRVTLRWILRKWIVIMVGGWN
jgi:hypothetical protein